METKNLVVPGDFLGTSEEFIVGDGVYDERGKIYAAVVGEVKIEDKRISVVPRVGTPPLPRAGDIVIGRVEDVKENVVVVSIACIQGCENRSVATSERGIIHISNIKNSYVTNLQQEFAHEDIVRAKVIDAKALRLSTEQRNLGVIKAICGRCKSSLVRRGNVLFCETCRKVEMRKIADDYGKVVI
ncbi:exosome complex RNA-binding protein Csl4 [Candidatus Alkanophaga liquidiphilum]|nr:Exosome complex RNA-binding protein Csl4 [Candidatus Alkanophaga liquidiphilum]RLG37882.1 MAG: RNA-binding protein [Candidatus Alkanophagales archaeon]